MKKLLNKKIVSIQHDKEKFIINLEKDSVDLVKEYELAGYKINIHPSVLEQIETGYFNDLYITAVRNYDGKYAMGARENIVKQKRFTVTMAVKADLEMPDSDSTLIVTFSK